MRRLLAVLLVPLLAAALPAQAYYQPNPIQGPRDPTLSAPSGEYLDPGSLVVYHYDSLTDTLVPAGVAVGTSGFFMIDAYATGERTATANHLGECRGPEFCIAVKALPANPERRQHEIWVEYQTSCDPEPLPLGRTFFSGPAYKYDPAWSDGHCPDGVLDVWLKLDGQTMAHDAVDY